MKRLTESDWDEIRRFSNGMRASNAGGIEIVIDASSIAELFDELEALRAEVVALKKRKRAGTRTLRAEIEASKAPPMPPVAPVTRAVRPVSCRSILAPFGSGFRLQCPGCGDCTEPMSTALEPWIASPVHET